MPRLPKAALPHQGDVEINKSSVVMSLDDVALQDDDMIRNLVSSLIVVGRSPTPGFVVVNGDEQICEPDGPDNYLYPTNSKVIFEKAGQFVEASSYVIC